jgi:hypothetical protein
LPTLARVYHSPLPGALVFRLRPIEDKLDGFQREAGALCYPVHRYSPVGQNLDGLQLLYA